MKTLNLNPKTGILTDEEWNISDMNKVCSEGINETTILEFKEGVYNEK